MTAERVESEPPDSLADAFDMVDAWQNGQLTLSPEGVAQAVKLQRARIGRLSTVGAGVEA